jgi:hypothetical protein
MSVPVDSPLQWSILLTTICIIELQASLQVGLVILTMTLELWTLPLPLLLPCHCHTVEPCDHVPG